MDFAAIDFETANSDRTSACAIGVVIVREGCIAKRLGRLIRPKTLDFDDRHIRIHGIKPDDVCQAPSFEDVWHSVEPELKDLPLLAHNAAFDLGVLLKCLEPVHHPVSVKRYGCTCAIARKLIPGLPNHRLPTLSNAFGIACNHHDPASDAEACAQLAMIFDRMLGPDGLSSQLRPVDDFGKANLSRPDYWDVSVREYLADVTFTINLDWKESTCIGIGAAEPDGRFEEKRFVLTGSLNYLSKDDAQKTIEAQGGKVVSTVSRFTDFLVAGDAEHAKYARTQNSTKKFNRAMELSAAGEKVRILTESEFIQLLQ